MSLVSQSDGSFHLKYLVYEWVIVQAVTWQQSLERESNRSDSKMRARHLLSCLTDGEILILLSSQSVELVHGMLTTHFCILLPKLNWSLLLSSSPAGLSVPARGGLVDERTAASLLSLLKLAAGRHVG